MEIKTHLLKNHKQKALSEQYSVIVWSRPGGVTNVYKVYQVSRSTGSFSGAISLNMGYGFVLEAPLTWVHF